MGDLGDFYGGLSGKSKDDFDKGTGKYITYKNVFANAFASLEKLETVDVAETEHQNKVCIGDALFTQSSETFEELGMSSVWLHQYQPYLNSFCMGWRPRNNIIYSVFLGYLLRTPNIRKQIITQGQGISRINLAASRIAGIELYYPNTDEQEKIARMLSLLDSHISAQTKLIALFKKYKRGAIKSLLSPKGKEVFFASTFCIKLQIKIHKIASAFYTKLQVDSAAI